MNIQRQARCVICSKDFVATSNRPVKFCSNACKSKDYRQRNPATQEQKREAVERTLAWERANRERKLEQRRRYRERHGERLRAERAMPVRVDYDRRRARAYYAKNTEAFKARARDRKAKLRGAAGSVKPGRVKELMRLQKGRCAVCRVDLRATGHHVDHVMPLHLGGEHGNHNLQLLCPTCNRAKSAKHPTDFMRERGFLC